MIGQLDVTSEELSEALFQSLRLVAVGLAFAAYALLLDLDGPAAPGGRLRRSVLAVALATRLVPLGERDAAGYVEALGAVGSLSRACAAARSYLAARRRLARAFAEPRRVDGGPVASDGPAGRGLRRPVERARPPARSLPPSPSS